jgi:hypothetical protein
MTRIFPWIKTRVKQFAKRSYVKYLNYNRSLNEENLKNSETEKVCMSITRSLITNANSKFLLAPLSGKRYIKNADLEIFVILDRGSISITNHVYHYDVTVSNRNWQRIVGMYDNKVEGIRQEYEDEIMKNIEHSLTVIQNKIKEK